MDFGNDRHLDVCQEIESALKREYELNSKLTDTRAIFALDNAKIATKHHFGFAKNESLTRDSDLQGIIQRCVAIAAERVGKVNDLTLKDFSSRIDKIARSVRRHSQDGSRAYYDFIRNYVP